MKTAATDKLIALQFLAVVLPIGTLLLLQLMADSRRADALAHSHPLRIAAQHIRTNYKTFTNGAADAVDTGTIGSQSVKALHLAAEDLRALARHGELADVSEARDVLSGLAEAIPAGTTLDALLPLRAPISRGDQLTAAIDGELQRRDQAVVKDAIASAIRQKKLVVAAFLLTLLLSTFFVILARRRLKEQIEADAAVERQRRAELETASIRFGMATQAARAGVYELRADDGSLWWSDSMYELYGKTPGASPPTVTEWLDLVHPDDRNEASSAVAAAFNEHGQLRACHRVLHPDGTLCHIETLAAVVTDSTDGSRRLVGIDLDVTARVEAERREEELQHQLRMASRQAGMAEVATNVLHNVGNVLNSVNVSASLVAEGMRKPKAAGLGRVVALLHEHRDNLGEFVTRHERGRHLPAYLGQLAEHLTAEGETTVQEMNVLQKNIAHIKEIVAMQQNYAKRAGVTEAIAVTTIADDSLHMTQGEFDRHDVELRRDFRDDPVIQVDRHKVLQILVNLLRNAKAACSASGRSDKTVTMSVATGDGNVMIAVSDNGIGIAPEVMSRIFSYGFTTKKEGHGFGLHGAALAARELGGDLRVATGGPDRGATFTLVLPLMPGGKRDER